MIFSGNWMLRIGTVAYLIGFVYYLVFHHISPSSPKFDYDIDNLQEMILFHKIRANSLSFQERGSAERPTLQESLYLQPSEANLRTLINKLPIGPNENESTQIRNSTIVQSKSGKLFPCDDCIPRGHYGQRGNYWVLYNYIRSTKRFRCDQSITYTTHSDWTFLDNLIPLLERWPGPISITLYAPGTDFVESLKRIKYLRECTISSAPIKERVTFHLFFDQHHMPKMKIPDNAENVGVNCSLLAETLTFGEGLQTYKERMKLLYPVNVGRNVAKEMATTHYVLPSDIELYPNPDLIPDFMEMLHLNPILHQTPRKVFVLPIFEIEANVTSLPKDKKELIQMLKSKIAIPFHKYVCPECHLIPKDEEWQKTPFQPGLRVFHVAKRQKPYDIWEPIYIGTKSDPGYDERLSWEGQKDKMTQAYILCVLDYAFHILDNGFLVHRPGIKRFNNKLNSTRLRMEAAGKQAVYIYKEILPELEQLYGTRSGCIM